MAICPFTAFLFTYAFVGLWLLVIIFKLSFYNHLFIEMYQLLLSTYDFTSKLFYLEFDNNRGMNKNLFSIFFGVSEPKQQ